jgi:hypothetical protein
MKPIDIILDLMNPKLSVRDTMQAAWDQDVEEFWIGLDLATGPNWDFHITKVPALDEADEEPGYLTFGEFYTLAMALSEGSLADLDAKTAVDNAAMSSNAVEWNLWYRRILLKSLSKHLPMSEIQKELIRLTTE